MKRRAGFRLAGAAACVFVLLALSGCAARGPSAPAILIKAEEWSYRERSGRLLTTPHYALHTTVADAELVEASARAMEKAYAFYRELLPAANEPAAPMELYLFAQRDDWADYTRKLTGPRAGTFLQIRGGGFVERGVGVIEYVSHETTFPILTHEGLHQFVHHCVRGEIPAWLNEGLAVLAEGQRWTKSELARFDPGFNPSRENSLTEAMIRNQLIPLVDLLRIDASDVIGDGDRRIGTYYAQVWALLLYLREGDNPTYQEGFRRLIAQLGPQDVAPFAQASQITAKSPANSFGEALFRAFIADDVLAFERDWHTYLRERFLRTRPKWEFQL